MGDPSYFVSTGGCHISARGEVGEARHCPETSDGLGKQARILLKHPMTELNVGGWNEIEWRIKWSEYALGENKTDPGIMTSLGWVRLLVNDVTVVDEKLPVGNNAQGRVPYFKLGIYNPSGKSEPSSLSFKNYEYSQITYEQMEEKHKHLMDELKLNYDYKIISPQQHTEKFKEEFNAKVFGENIVTKAHEDMISEFRNHTDNFQ